MTCVASPQVKTDEEEQRVENKGEHDRKKESERERERRAMCGANIFWAALDRYAALFTSAALPQGAGLQ